MFQPTKTGDAEIDELLAEHYRWWTIGLFRGIDTGVKLGPVSIVAYRWFDGRIRVSWTYCAGPEHVIWGGPIS